MDFAINFCSRLSLKNNRKFVRKPLSEGAPSLQNRSGRPPGQLSAHFRHQRAFLWPKSADRPWGFWHFWAQSGARPDPENHPKIDLLRKRGAKEGIFLDFCRVHRFSRFCLRFRLDFKWKIDVFSNAVSSRSVCFFRNGDPHDSVVFTIRNLLFHFSPSFVFFERKKTKKWSKTVGRKKPRKKTLRGSVLEPKIH